jgi:N-sulfoglucosamine sulfohydrolase
MRWPLGLTLLLAWSLAPAAASARQPAGPKPRNVVLIIADDLGRDLGCYGNQAIRTPNLDKLAKRGVLFTRAYSTVSSCSPSRASILTGLYTHQNGQYGLQHPPHSQQTHPWVQSLPNLLRAGGYWTGLIGKFHVGPNSVYNFHQVITKGTGGNRDVAAMARLAREFITQREKRPFFLVYAFSDPHRAAKGFANEKFARDPAEVRYDPGKVVVPYHLPDTPEVRRDLAEYYQSVSRMDRGVGLLLDVLRAAGQLDDTLIIFISDNGIPFPGAKTTLYAAGIHLPLIMSCPDTPPGRTSDVLVSYVDLAPTILDWAQVKGPKYQLPGRSLLPLLRGAKDTGRDTVFASHQFHEITMAYPMRALITPKYKLIVNLTPDREYPLASDLWGSPSWQGIRKRGDKMMGQRSVQAFLRRPTEELYDLTRDPNELHNLAADPAHAEALADLRRRLRAWQRATNDPWTILYREENPADNR